MGTSIRVTARKIAALSLVVMATGGGYLAMSDSGTSSSRAVKKVDHATPHKKLSAADMMLIATSANGGVYLRYAGLTSGVVTPDHANDIPLDSFQFGVSRSVSGGVGVVPRTVSPASISEITLSRTTDLWSAKLFNQSLRGTANATTHAPVATVYFSTPDATAVGGFRDYLQIDLKEVLVSSYSVSSGGFQPSESISLSFSNVMTFTARMPAGTTQTVTYNLTTQT